MRGYSGFPCFDLAAESRLPDSFVPPNHAQMKQLFNRILFGGVGGGNRLAEIGLLVLRVAAGLFIAIGHGWGKVTAPSDFIDGVEAMGFPLPVVSGWMAILGEFLGGLLLALGLLTRPAAAWLIGVFLGAALVAHQDSFTGQAPFFEAEFALLYLIIAVCFLLTGSGHTGVDRMLRK